MKTKTIWAKIMDGKSIVAVTSKEEAICRYRDKYECSRKQAEKEFEEEWQEVRIYE